MLNISLVIGQSFTRFSEILMTILLIALLITYELCGESVSFKKGRFVLLPSIFVLLTILVFTVIRSIL